MNVAAGLVARLRRLGYTVAGTAPGVHEVTAHAGRPLHRRPRLVLPEDVLAEYIAALRHDAAEAGLAPLDLIETHIQEELDSIDPEGRNRTTALGVRRDHAGRPEWFVTQDPRPPPDAAPGFRWDAAPPDAGAP
ncbi:hypothetical protein [Actinomadura sp. WMMB 499]|uniref:hypothetical protein n=1 Tax=Actinomadura sp. WMMB 499 TaxID=1219491 RepID=UPI0012475416|nr:hypothetical protein [Actinomadura sp. WMMB 499]QFG20782.1 hypothetical protein F7P10_06110 [Actinomadura sp. WMMB 499]